MTCRVDAPFVDHESESEARRMQILDEFARTGSRPSDLDLEALRHRRFEEFGL